MSDKPVAALVTAFAIAPFCVVCALGPAVVGSALGGVVGWFGGLRGVATVLIMVVVAAIATAMARAWLRRRQGLAQRPPGHRPAGLRTTRRHVAETGALK